jgi:hypothetical protein
MPSCSSEIGQLIKPLRKRGGFFSRTRYDFNPACLLPDGHLLELGRMIAVWASLESMMVIAVSKLAGYADG